MRYLRVFLVAAVVAATLVSGPAAHAAGVPISACGQTVTTNAFLTQNLVCTGDGIVVGASGITVDLKGFVVRGDRGADDFGIDDSGGWDNLTIKNGVLRNFDFGMYAAIADKVNVSAVASVGNLGSGIFVQGTGASLTNVTAAGDTYGIALIGDDMKVTSSTSARNGVDGIFITGDHAAIKSSSAVSNNTIGIVVTGIDGSVSSSTAQANGVFGIFLNGGSNSAKSDTARGNGGTGIEVDGDNDVISASTTSENTGGGIHVSGEAESVNKNRATANGFDTSSSDLTGLGISVDGFVTTPPAGKNTANANDDPAECNPASLC